MVREATGFSHRPFGVAEATDPERKNGTRFGAREPGMRGRNANA